MPRKDGRDLNEARGTGFGSRTALSREDLVDSGWQITSSGKGYRWKSPEGRVFWSSKAVAEYLESRTEEISAESDSDVDYVPASSEDALNSPEKRPASHSEVPIPNSVHKR